MKKSISMNVLNKYFFYIGGQHPHYKCMEVNKMRDLIYEFIEYWDDKEGYQAAEAINKCNHALLDIELLAIDREHRCKLYAELAYNKVEKNGKDKA